MVVRYRAAGIGNALLASLRPGALKLSITVFLLKPEAVLMTGRANRMIHAPPTICNM